MKQPSMASVVRMINRRLKEVYDFFGYKSPEYNQLRSIVYGNWGYGDRQYFRKDKGKPLQISRGKKAIEAFSSNVELVDALPYIWETIKNMGTVKQMAKKYMMPDEYKQAKTMKAIQGLKSTILPRVEAAYAALYNDDDIYAEIQNTSDDDLEDDIFVKDLREVLDIFHEKTGQSVQKAEEKWDKIQRKYTEAVANHEMRVRIYESTEDNTIEPDYNPDDYDHFTVPPNMFTEYP